MKLVVADCSAIYTGRGDTQLPRGVRSLLIKDDGSVSIHNDTGIKPLNYMKDANFSESTNALGEQVWNFDSRKENLSVTIHSMTMSCEVPLLVDDPGLQRDGTEDHLQGWLADNPTVFGPGFTLVRREYPTGNGPVDLLVLDPEGNPVAIEVKRVAMLGAVDQCRRYLDALRDPEKHDGSEGIDFSNVRGMIAAVDIRPRTLEWAAKHNITPVIVPYNWREISSYDLRDVLSDVVED